MSATARETPTSFGAALKEVKAILSSRHDLIERGLIDTEAEQIVLGAIRKTQGVSLSRLELYSRLGDRLPERAGDEALIMAMARAEGRLLQHLTGVQAFLEHEYEVGPDVLVPRPETELLAEAALSDLRATSPKFGIEIGIGSGAIAIELLCAIPSLRMLASELSRPAERMARRNAERILGPSPGAQARLRILDAKTPLEVLEPFLRENAAGADFLISNPPYLISDEELDREVLENEPREALFSPASDAIHFYRKIAEGAAPLLKADGKLYLEIPHERSGAIREIFERHGWEPQILRDLVGRDRILRATHG